MSQKTRAANATQISSLLNDNTTQDITPLDIRTVIGDILDSLGMYQQVTRSALQGLITGLSVEQKTMYEISDAVSSAKRIIVFGFDSSTISTLAINLTDNSLGYYDISGDAFTGIRNRDIFTPTIGQTAFTLSATPSNPEVFLNGIEQKQGVDYNFTGTAFTWLNNDFSLDTNDTLTIYY